jgi:hypothetical protein
MLLRFRFGRSRFGGARLGVGGGWRWSGPTEARVWGRSCAQVLTCKGGKRAGVRAALSAAKGLRFPAIKAVEGVGEMAKRLKAFGLLPVAVKAS